MLLKRRMSPVHGIWDVGVEKGGSIYVYYNNNFAVRVIVLIEEVRNLR
jgi:hypothetical protein